MARELHEMENLVPCGVCRVYGDATPVYADLQRACFVVQFDFDENPRVLSELVARNVAEIPDIDGFIYNFERNNSDLQGIIVFDDGKVAVFLDDSRVEMRTLLDSNTPTGSIITFDMDEEYLA